MKRAGPWILAACSACCWACSLTQSLDHLSLAEGQGGAGAGASSSATSGGTGTTGASTTGASVSSSASATTGGGGPGGSGQGGEGAGGGSGGAFCVEGEHDFCVDFEEGLGDWSYELVDVERGSTQEVSTERASSPTHALRSYVPAREDDDLPVYATIVKDFVGPWRPMKIDFELFVELPDWQPGDVNAGVFAVSCPSTDENGDPITIGAAFSLGADYVTVSFSHLGAEEGLDLDTFSFGQWAHVALEFDPGGFLRGSLGAIEIEKVWPEPLEPGAAECSITLGVLGYNDPAPDFVVFVDDVVVDFGD